MIEQQLDGESKAEFRARIKTQDEAAERYARASDQERAVIDQKEYWDDHRFVFIARIEGVEKARKNESALQSPIEETDITVEGSRFVDVFEPHEIRIVVLAWIKGKPEKIANIIRS